MIPIFEDEAALRQLYEQCRGLLLSGGDDVSPEIYGAELSEHTKQTSPARDHQEVQLIKWAMEDDKPLLGICRGMQLLNVALGGSLHQDILSAMPGVQDHEMSAIQKDFKHIVHTLKLKPNSHLARILGTTEIQTNALHHQAIDRLGDGLKVAANAEDGIIEAIELPSRKFVIGVQSHPESLDKQIDIWFKLFKAFISAAS